MDYTVRNSRQFGRERKVLSHFSTSAEGKRVSKRRKMSSPMASDRPTTVHDFRRTNERSYHTGFFSCPATSDDFDDRNSTTDGRKNIIRSMSACHQISNKCERNESIKIEALLSTLQTAPNSQRSKPGPRFVVIDQHGMPNIDIH